MARIRPFDRVFFSIVAILVGGGFLVFMSASLGLLARDGAQFSDVALKHFLVGIVGGGILLAVMSRMSYRLLRRWGVYIFAAAVVASLLVFIPGLGLELNGARRWINLGFTTAQPSEVLKIAYIIYLATWLSGTRLKTEQMLHGLVPFAAITGIVGMVLLLQRDTDTFIVIAVSGVAMFFSAGAKLRDLLLIFIVGIVVVGAVAIMRPYVLDRITSYINPSSDPYGSNYQVQQSLIAVGSGEWFGRGFGQSVQKFNYLPEPISDSIFAVYAEELGFLGSVVLIGLFVSFALRGYWIATRAADAFGGLIVVGLVTAITFQSFLNIAAILGLVPLSGLPLIFISHGGSALAAALAAVGIVLAVSRSVKTR